MLTFIFAIIGLLVIIGVISILSDFKNSGLECIIGIAFILVLYGLITGVIDFMFWLGYQIGPPYAILVTILLIVSPFVIWFAYNKLKSNGSIDVLSNKIKEDKKIAVIPIIIVLVVILIVVLPIITYNPLDSEPFTVDVPKDMAIGDYKGVFVYDDEMRGGVAIGGDDVIIAHHDAHGKKLKHYVDKCKNRLYKPKIKNMSIDGVNAYNITDYDWGFDVHEEWILFIKDNECYLIKFDGKVDKEVRNQIINSFKFK